MLTLFTQITFLLGLIALPGEKEMLPSDYVADTFTTYEITAYTTGYESTGKTPSHELYGVTASGRYVTEGHTIACPPSLPFGTKIYVLYTDTTYTCEDRGGAIKDVGTNGYPRLDIYIPELDEALRFGRRILLVEVLTKEGE